MRSGIGTDELGTESFRESRFVKRFELITNILLVLMGFANDNKGPVYCQTYFSKTFMVYLRVYWMYKTKTKEKLGIIDHFTFGEPYITSIKLSS